MKTVKNPCLRLTSLCRRHASSSSTAAASTDVDCDGGVGTRSDGKHLLTDKPSHNASLRHLNDQLRSLLDSASPGRLSATLWILGGMLSPDSASPPDAATRSIVFSSLAKRSQPLSEESLALLVEMAKMGFFPPDAFVFTQLISKLCRGGATSGAWDYFHAVKDAGGSIEAPVFNALLIGLAAIRDVARMNLLFSEMKDLGVRPHVVTIGILINHLCKSRRLDDALNVLDAMLQDGLFLFDWMRSSHACDPDNVTYTILIDAFCKAAEFDMAHELLTKMEKERIAVNVFTLNAFVNGMCRHGMIGSALDFFRKKKVEWPEVKGNAITYNILIGAFFHSNNVGRATALFGEMIKEGVSSNSAVYSTLISGLTQVVGFARRRGWIRHSRYTTKCARQGVGLISSLSLIDAFCKTGDFSKADKFLNKMVDDGCKPDVVTYGALINGFCKAGDLNQAMKIFRSMDVSVVPPNTVIYNILIDSYCKNQKVDAAIDLLDEMQKQDILPNATTYTSIFKGLKDHNMSDKALELMDKMNSHGCKPNYVTMDVLTKWLTAIGEIERLRLFVQWTISSDI
ncbi:hypothetical protein ZIOFF_013377 [Zingiber officinale]|uniref:Pentatricopeptide repeat-containing protein n=1 Tax=Zingiber officinale TaxID=94328 RepID=A0A8J5LU54_ZINOF|nr:hypothetical protein ZIOFF_013377 [Zingiber officinale]